MFGMNAMQLQVMECIYNDFWGKFLLGIFTKNSSTIVIHFCVCVCMYFW